MRRAAGVVPWVPTNLRLPRHKLALRLTHPAQVARGAQGPDGWFIGFNLTRKFF